MNNLHPWWISVEPCKFHVLWISNLQEIEYTNTHVLPVKVNVYLNLNLS